VLKGQRKDFWDKEGAIPEWRVQELLKEHKLGYWQVQVRFYGDEAVNKAKAEVVKKAFKKHLDAAPHEEWWRQGDPVNQFDPTMGVPSAVALQMGDWVGGRGAHMGFSPVVPATSKHVLGQLKRSRKIIADHDVDFYASFTVGGRFATNINMLMYDRDKPEQVKNMRKLFDALIVDTAKAGYGEYRTHLGWMDPVNATYNFNNGAQRRLNEKVKDALDPNGILVTGQTGRLALSLSGHGRKAGGLSDEEDCIVRHSAARRLQACRSSQAPGSCKGRSAAAAAIPDARRTAVRGQAERRA
jgi:4-cresol dehydrogenase (hydroxylating)